MILIAGGVADPNLQLIVARLEQLGAAHRTLFTGAKVHRRVEWDLTTDQLWIDDEFVTPSAVFLRYDVFGASAPAETLPAADGWFTTVLGWALSHPDARMFNRASTLSGTNKPYLLSLANRFGLATPDTMVTNDVRRLRLAGSTPLVAKPVAGGALCEPLETVVPGTRLFNGAAAIPAIVQERLEPPEVRVYVVGGRVFGFSVESQQLDYRADANAQVKPLPALDQSIAESLAELVAEQGLDFAAADFKTRPSDGALVFLELNNSPMFAAFDRAADGALSGAIVDWLRGEGTLESGDLVRGRGEGAGSRGRR